MVGQNHIKLTLMSELEQSSFTHAYLFCGPRGLGKTTIARLVAKAVNCEKRKEGEAEPCNQCQSCSDIMAGRSLDMIEIDAASHTGVDNVRENIIDNVRFAPHRSKFKVFIIDEVHMLSVSAFNALLKTLEEPPAHVIFMLCTTEAHKVPETIVSRCQRFDFKKVAPNEALKRLRMIAEAEKVAVDEEVLEMIAFRSEGCMRDAENFLGQVLSLGEKKITMEQASLVLPVTDLGLVSEFLKIILTKKTGAGLEMINKFMNDGVDLEAFNKEVVIFLRKLLLIKEGVVKSDWLGMMGKLGGELNTILADISAQEIIETLKTFLSAGRELRDSEIPQLPLEVAIVSLGLKFKGGIAGETDSRASLDQASYKIPAIIRKEKIGKEEESETAEIKIKVSTETAGNTLEDIGKRWNEIIKASHKESRDLMFINESMVWPVGLVDNCLELGFKYDLHKSRFETNGNKDFFLKAIKEVTDFDLRIRSKTLKPSELAELDMAREEKEHSQEKISGVKVTENDILGQVLESFGGEVIE